MNKFLFEIMKNKVKLNLKIIYLTWRPKYPSNVSKSNSSIIVRTTSKSPISAKVNLEPTKWPFKPFSFKIFIIIII